ncbi:MAG TPA: replication initiator protein A [Rubrobacter sp.]|nr:replication initiator protein A [Rubrobacter sp.]
MAESGVQELRLFEFEGGPLIQVEVNLEEAPLFMFKRRHRHEESTEARNTVLTKNGDRLEQYWKITAHRDFGLPGPQDQDVFVAVMTVVSRRGGIPPDGRVSFTLYELLEILGKTHAGKNYDDLRDSLDRLSETSIYAENAFYSKEDEDFRSHRFRMWSVHFSRKKRKGRASEHHTLRFDDILVRSYNASYLKSLDSDFYYGLRRPLARSLYKLVDVKRKESLSWSVELEGLRLLLSMPETYKYPSAIKRQLEPAHRELVEKGFLSRADFEERGRGPTKTNVVRYRVSQRFVRERSRPLPELSDGERFATEALVAQGVWPQAARELVVKHGAGHCLHYVEALPYQEGVKNPAGWLRTHIENAWPVRVPEEPPTLPAAEANETVIEVPDLASEGENAIRPGRLGPDPSLSDPAKPEPAQAAAAHRRAASEEVEMRRASGEFDGAIEAFETLPYEEYRKFVGHAVRHLDGNRYYVNLDGDLYVYSGGVDSEHHHFLRRLNRSSA